MTKQQQQEKEKKLAALSIATKNIEKSHGMGTIMDLKKPILPIETISTGSMVIDDELLKVGGLPKGRILEIYGPESSGKTTIALQTIASCQREGGIAIFIDVEQALDLEYAKNLGVKVDELIMSQPDSAEQALDILETYVNSGGADLIIVDSVAALSPQAEIDGEMSDQHVGLQARLMAKALRKITSPAKTNNTTILFINQLRANIGAMGYGPKETTPGGNALKFYSSVRLDIRRTGSIKKGEEVIGNKVKVKIAKNKVAAPFAVGEIEIYFGKGISKEAEILNKALDLGLVKKAGAWFSYDGDKIGQGKEKVLENFRNNVELYEKITKQVLDAKKEKLEEK
jgi:recombination protein RecA